MLFPRLRAYPRGSVYAVERRRILTPGRFPRFHRRAVAVRERAGRFVSLVAGKVLLRRAHPDPAITLRPSPSRRRATIPVRQRDSCPTRCGGRGQRRLGSAPDCRDRYLKMRVFPATALSPIGASCGRIVTGVRGKDPKSQKITLTGYLLAIATIQDNAKHNAKTYALSASRILPGTRFKLAYNRMEVARPQSCLNENFKSDRKPPHQRMAA